MMTMKKYNLLLVSWERTKRKEKEKRHLQICQQVPSGQPIRWNSIANDTIKYEFEEVYGQNHPTHENDIGNARCD